MKNPRLNRRRFLFLSFLATPGLVWADATRWEPHWVRTRTVKLSDNPTHRVVHITDIHYKGDQPYLETVVRKINALSPDAVCFTGDLIEDAQYLPETLEILQQIKSPIYGVPGNHDYESGANFAEIQKAFSATGGHWLTDSHTMTADGKIHIVGATCQGGRPVPIPPKEGAKNILLLHYPLLAERVKHNFDLMLAGHSHGGQIRLPIYGAFMLPYWVGKYDMGLFRLPMGPLYVNPGIGWLSIPYRFNCRPEITVFEV